MALLYDEQAKATEAGLGGDTGGVTGGGCEVVQEGPRVEAAGGGVEEGRWGCTLSTPV